MEVRCWGQEARAIILAQETRWAWQQTKQMKCCRRLKIHSLLQKLVDEGRTTACAIADVKLAYGAAKLVTQFSEAIWLIPTHPSLNPLPQRRNDPPLAPPNRGRDRGAGRGGRVQALPTQHSESEPSIV